MMRQYEHFCAQVLTAVHKSAQCRRKHVAAKQGQPLTFMGKPQSQ